MDGNPLKGSFSLSQSLEMVKSFHSTMYPKSTYTQSYVPFAKWHRNLLSENKKNCWKSCQSMRPVRQKPFSVKFKKNLLSDLSFANRNIDQWSSKFHLFHWQAHFKGDKGYVINEFFSQKMSRCWEVVLATKNIGIVLQKREK